MKTQMKSYGNAQRALYVIGLALMGLSFYVIVLLLLVVGAMSLFSGRAHAATPGWIPTGHMTTPHKGHTATLLQSGKVLVVGHDGVPTAAETYDPATGKWTATGPMSGSHQVHTASRLTDGRVLVAGGDTSELYNPATGSWTRTGNLVVPRTYHTATLLQNGKVLIAGGFDAATVQHMLASAELYDPATGTWSLTGPLNLARFAHTMTLLRNGSVLVAGGSFDSSPEYGTSTTELYDPATAAWEFVGEGFSASDHTATLLPDGRVLVAGGRPFSYLNAQSGDATFDTARLFDPATRSWIDTGTMTGTRASHAAVLLANGQVLVVGGQQHVGPDTGSAVVGLNTAELYNPTSSTWTGAASIDIARTGHTLTLLPNGQVLLAGGRDETSGQTLDSASLYTSTVPPVLIDASFTGSWFNPVQGGHGLMLEVLPDNRLLALWFAFDPAGKQAWFGGVGTYSGNTATITGAALPTGGRWIPDFDPNAIVANSWGTLTLTFVDHDHGHVDFVAGLGFGSGGMDLLRLTNVATQSAVVTPIGSPGAVVADASGNVYFSSSPNRIFKVDAQGVLTRIAGSGQPGYDGDGGPATEARFNFPLSYLELVQDPIDYSELVGGLALDAQHNLYVADAYNNRVRRIDNNGIVTTVLGNGFRGNSGDGGPAVQGTVYWPQGVAVDNQGNLYVTSAYGPLRQVSASGLLRTITAQNCGQTYLSAGLCVPEQIAVDSSGNVFAPDGYCRVREVRGDGSTLTVAGNDDEPSGGFAFTCGYSGDGGPATAAALSAPYAVAIDAGNKLYIADTGNHCIRKVAAGIISTVAGRCTQSGFAGDGGTATQALLDHPRGVAVGADGSLYIADTNNNRIRKVLPNGVITTIAGNGGALVDTEHGTIGPGFTGNWFDPAQSGHGLMLEVLSDNRLLAYWFAFDPAGNQAWFGGVGSYSGTTATIPNMILPTGGKWIPNFDPHSIVPNVWGTLTFTFTSCNRGTVTFNSTYGFGSGSMNLTRLTQPAGLSCP
jgi:sugar lactone lactonase YvrE